MPIPTLLDSARARESSAARRSFRRTGTGTNPTNDAVREAALDTLGAAQDLLTVVTLALLWASETDDLGEVRAYAESAATAAGVASALLTEAYEAVEWSGDTRGTGTADTNRA